MAKISGSDFYSYILRQFKRTDKSTEVYEAITDAIMEMRLAFGFEEYKEESYSSVDTLGDYKIPLPTDFQHLFGDVVILEDDQSYSLTKLTKDDYDRKFPNQNYSSVTKAKPTHYCVYNEQVFLGPVPDSTDYSYQMNYSTEDQTAVTSVTTEVPFTDRYRWILRALTLGNIYEVLNNDKQAQKWRQKGIDGIQSVVISESYNTGAAEMVRAED